MAILGGIVRAVGSKAAGWAVKKFSREGAKRAAAKEVGKGIAGATGMGGVTNPRPAHAPTHTPPAGAPRDSSTVSPEASRPEQPVGEVPNFTYTFGA